MSIMSLKQDNVLFASDMPKEVNDILQEAVVLYDDTERAKKKLLEALEIAPHRLEVYVALYKFYFYKNFIDDAESIALKALSEAAAQGGFSADWTTLTENSTQWTPAPDAQRFYLYTLKALAFINLRKNRTDLANAILNKLITLDPKDQVGGSVIRDLASGSLEA